MESVENLREWARGEYLRKCASLYDTKRLREVNDFADAIEYELKERYVELPLDADGMPIHVGDDMETLMHGYEGEHSPVICIGLTEDGWEVDGDAPSSMLHYQPDTWERIIEDACKRAVDGYPDETGHIAMTDLVARCKALSNNG